MIVLDSNIWIASFDRSDSTHAEAEAVFEELEQQKEVVIVPEYILLETVTMINRLVGKKQSDVFLGLVFNTDGVEVLPSTPDFLEEVVTAYMRYNTKRFSFADVSLIVLSLEFTVYTFDQHLRKEIARVK